MNHPHEPQAAAMDRAGELPDGEQLRSGNLCEKCKCADWCAEHGCWALTECINSGQVSAAQVVAHAEAGEVKSFAKLYEKHAAGIEIERQKMQAEALATCEFKHDEFIVHKIDPEDRHSAWRIILPTSETAGDGCVIEFNHHFNDDVDQARARFVASACNAVMRQAVDPYDETSKQWQAGFAAGVDSCSKATGWPAGMLQDDSRGLSKALSRDPNARALVRDAAIAIERFEPAQEEITDAERYQFAAKHFVLAGGGAFGWNIAPATKAEWDRYLDREIRASKGEKT